MPQSSSEIYFALPREPIATRPIPNPQTNEPAIDRADEELSLVKGWTAICGIAVVCVAVDLKVGPPNLASRLRVERSNRTLRRREIKPAVAIRRRRLEGGRLAA